MADPEKQNIDGPRFDAQKPLLSGVKGLFADPKYADLTIKCGTREWKVHKAVVCPQSDFFAKACDGGFKESKEHAVTLKEADPNAVHAMIEYFYTCDFDDMGAALVDNALSLHILVYRLAGQYLLKPLQDLAALKFEKHAAARWKEPDFAAAIAQAYDHASEDIDALKTTVLSVTHSHASALFRNPDQYPEFHRVVRDTPYFAAEVALMEYTEGKTAKLKWFRCDNANCRLATGPGFCSPADVPANNIIYCQGCGKHMAHSAWDKYQVKDDD